MQNSKRSTMRYSIDDFPEDILIAILSCLPLKESVKTSVLSQKWRYLWHFTTGSLDFQSWDAKTCVLMGTMKFIRWVNRVLNLHRGSKLDKLIIKFWYEKARSHYVDSWIDFAIRKEVKRFEMEVVCRGYEFPDLSMLLSRSRGTRCPFFSLRALRLVKVNIKDEVVQYFSVSCPYLEELCVDGSDYLKNLKIISPLPYFKRLEISYCNQIQSMEISVNNLSSVAYIGDVISVPFKNVPNLTELTLGGTYCYNFIFEPEKHLSYSVMLEKLVLTFYVQVPRIPLIACSDNFPQFLYLKELELNIYTNVGRGLLFFLLLVQAAPSLHRFRLKMKHLISFPEVCGAASKFTQFDHRHLKKVEMVKYIGQTADQELLSKLVMMSPLLEMIIMEPQVFDCDSEVDNMKSAQEKLGRELPTQIKLVVL